MFSRYKKTQAVEATPVEAAPASPAPAPKAAASEGKPAVARRPAAQSVAASVAPADKEKKRKERLAEVKLELHRSLLDNLNLAALDQASENELREEINDISTEYMQEKGIVLNRDERRTMISDLYDEVKGLGPLEPLLKDETISDILVNGPQQIDRKSTRLNSSH